MTVVITNVVIMAFVAVLDVRVATIFNVQMVVVSVENAGNVIIQHVLTIGNVLVVVSTHDANQRIAGCVYTKRKRVTGIRTVIAVAVSMTSANTRIFVQVRRLRLRLPSQQDGKVALMIPNVTIITALNAVGMDNAKIVGKKLLQILTVRQVEFHNPHLNPNIYYFLLFQQS